MMRQWVTLDPVTTQRSTCALTKTNFWVIWLEKCFAQNTCAFAEQQENMQLAQRTTDAVFRLGMHAHHSWIANWPNFSGASCKNDELYILSDSELVCTKTTKTCIFAVFGVGVSYTRTKSCFCCSTLLSYVNKRSCKLACIKLRLFEAHSTSFKMHISAFDANHKTAKKKKKHVFAGQDCRIKLPHTQLKFVKSFRKFMQEFKGGLKMGTLL